MKWFNTKSKRIYLDNAGATLKRAHDAQTTELSDAKAREVGLVEIAVLNLLRAMENEKRSQEQMQMTVMSQREAELQYQRAMECCNKK